MKARSRLPWVLTLAAACSGAHAATEQEALVLLSSPLSDLNRFSADLDSDHDLGLDGNIERTTFRLDATFSVDLPQDWRLVSRTELPHIEAEDDKGWGDLDETLLFTPSKQREVAWAFGAAVRFATAEDDTLGINAFGIGPAVSVVQRDGSDVSGLVAALIWGGTHDTADIYRLEGFTTWNRKGAGVSLDLQAEYDTVTNETTCPISLGVSRVVRMGASLVDVGAQVRYFLDVPIDKGAWGLGVTITLVRDFAVR
jgi:hypothetical protein